MARVLLIEDDPAVQKGVSLALCRRGHEVEVVESGEKGLLAVEQSLPEVVLLDLMLPGMSGVEVCRRIREAHRLPIIIISARGDDFDLVVGLEAGADDYMVKPVSGDVLGARMQAVLRRVAVQDRPAGPEGAGGVDVYGDLTVDRAAMKVALDGRELVLAPSELKLLLFLSASPGQVFSRQQLLQHVWEHSFYGDHRLVDACVNRLRGKLENDARHPVYVQTVRGFGYRFGPG